MTRIMSFNGVPHAPKGRVRNAIGHRYLDILNAGGDTDASSTTSTESSHDGGLDLLVLGFTTSTAMDEIDFALCRFTQSTPDAPLFLDLIKVCSCLKQWPSPLMVSSMIQLSCPPRFVVRSSRCCKQTQHHLRCYPRWTPR